MRLDQYLVVNGFFDSRNKASNAVKLGHFTVDKKRVIKPSFDVLDGSLVEKVVNEKTYVARSAHKLIKAYSSFKMLWEGKVIADLGASTGGFCQVLIDHNVKKVFAVDIGTAQLHPNIKKDSRIVNMEHTNARYLTAASFSEPVDAVTADLSFISIKTILPAIYHLLDNSGEAVVLIKPQFEAGSAALSKNGVVTDLKVQYKVVEEVISFAQTLGFGVLGVCFSGLAGESGNREYLLYLKKDAASKISTTDVHFAVYTEE